MAAWLVLCGEPMATRYGGGEFGPAPCLLTQCQCKIYTQVDAGGYAPKMFYVPQPNNGTNFRL